MARKTFPVLFLESKAHAYRMPNDTGWQDRHFAAWLSARPGPAQNIRRMIEAIGGYADSHAARYESSIGADHFLGVAWLDMLKACRVLLNGETAGLDCGTIDALLCAMAMNEGFTEGDL